MNRWQLVLAAAVLLTLIAAAANSTAGQADAAAALAVPADLRDAVAPHGLLLEALEVGADGGVVSASAALDVAAKEYGAGADIHRAAYIARLTLPDYYRDADRRPIVKRRVVYVVQLTGVELYPMRGGSVASMHHELLVIIDAVTGDPILSITVR